MMYCSCNHIVLVTLENFVLKILLRPHVHNLQRRVGQLHYMAWFQRFSVDVIDIVRMENARSTAV
jgi:hypothetical protein